MGLFLNKKEKLQKKINKLNNKYLDLLDEYDCSSCECFNNGSVKTFSERFAKCTDCPYYKEIIAICNELDASIKEKDNL